MTEDLPGGGHRLSPAELDGLDARWARAWTPAEIARRLDGVSAPWYVAAGWALDLFRGEKSREHEDLEIAVPAGRFAEVRDRFPGHVWDAVGSGTVWETPSPEVLAAVHQTWLRDLETDEYRVDVFREPHDGETWICRRDETIRLPYADIIRRTSDGIPYLAPELVLLFKAKHDRPKDRADFEGTVPLLSASERDRLRELLAKAHPGHEWLAAL